MIVASEQTKQPRVRSRNTNRRGRLSTVDLLNKGGLFSKKGK